MKTRHVFLIIFMVAGIVFPWYYNLQTITPGVDFISNMTFFVTQTFANSASASTSLDIFIAYLTFIVWVLYDGYSIKLPYYWAYPILGFLISFAFIFPAYLLMRERHQKKMV